MEAIVELAVPVAVKVTLLLPRVAVAVFMPAVVPRVRVFVARPLESVVLVIEASVPPPLATAQVTEVEGTGFPSESVMSTTKEEPRADPAVPDKLLPEEIAIFAAAAGLILNVLDVPLVGPLLDAERV